MSENPTTEAHATDEAAHIIANLLATMSDWEIRNMNSVAAALAWLRAHDHPGLSLRASVRVMMEATNV